METFKNTGYTDDGIRPDGIEEVQNDWMVGWKIGWEAVSQITKLNTAKKMIRKEIDELDVAEICVLPLDEVVMLRKKRSEPWFKTPREIMDISANLDGSLRAKKDMAENLILKGFDESEISEIIAIPLEIVLELKSKLDEPGVENSKDTTKLVTSEKTRFTDDRMNGMYAGSQAGGKAARQMAKEEMAKKMLHKDFNELDIAEISGLPLKEVSMLKRKQDDPEFKGPKDSMDEWNRLVSRQDAKLETAEIMLHKDFNALEIAETSGLPLKEVLMLKWKQNEPRIKSPEDIKTERIQPEDRHQFKLMMAEDLIARGYRDLLIAEICVLPVDDVEKLKSQQRLLYG